MFPEYVPTSHWAHEEELDDGEKEPAPQLVHSVPPTADEYVPAEQAWQEVELDDIETVPTLQLVHAVEPRAE